jgi:hypothetical protein
MLLPLTGLPEVYYIPKHWAQFPPVRYHCRLASGATGNLGVFGHVTGGIITDHLGKRVLATSAAGEEMRAEVGEAGVIIASKARYAHTTEPVIFSLSKEQMFLPDPDKLRLLKNLK